MKKVCVLASVFGVLLMGGCAENVSSADAHVCTHFYDTVEKSGSQVPYDLSKGSVELTQEHLMYALTLSSQDDSAGQNALSATGSFNIILNNTGSILRVTTSNLEAALSVKINGVDVAGSMNGECDVQSFEFDISSQAVFAKITVSLTTTSSQVLVTYEIL